MSPEYAMEGTFSVKSDVFSFGVLILEIVSSRRNTSFHNFDTRSINLIGYVSVVLLNPSFNCGSQGHFLGRTTLIAPSFPFEFKKIKFY